MVMKKLLASLWSPRLVKFGVVGVTGVVVNLGVLAVLQGAGVPVHLAAALAIEVSIISNFLLNSLWTFSDRTGGMVSQALRFHAVSLVGAGIQLAIFALLHRVFGMVYVAQVVGIGFGTVGNYLLNSAWTFARPARASA
jgi:dolichol-phosphate mannosyltransferase